MEDLQLGAPPQPDQHCYCDDDRQEQDGTSSDNPSHPLTANAGPTSEAPIESTRQYQKSLPSQQESDTVNLLVSPVHRPEAGLSPVAGDQQTLLGVGKSPWEVSHGLH